MPQTGSTPDHPTERKVDPRTTITSLGVLEIMLHPFMLVSRSNVDIRTYSYVASRPAHIMDIIMDILFSQQARGLTLYL